ncbi:MAG: hypothetical protein D6752_00005, partial [Candidatus Nitrosothermus koennekii]
FKGITHDFIKKTPKIEKEILRSYMNITPESLVSLSLFITFLTIPISILGIYIFINSNNIIGLILLAIPPLTFLIGINAPKFSISNRKAALEDELPYLIGYISILAGGGITLPFALERMSQNKLLPASAKEAMHMFMQIRLLGMNPISALENMAKYNPHDSFADFIGGYVTTLKSGGDVFNYLLAKLKDAYNYRSIRLKSLIEFTGNLAEAYMGIVVVLGIALLVMFTSQGLIAGSSSFGLSNDSIMQSVMFSSILIPMISVAFIGILHTNQPREPFAYNKAYLLFASLIPLIPAMIFLPDLLDILPINRDMFNILADIFSTLIIVSNILINYIFEPLINLLSSLKILTINIQIDQIADNIAKEITVMADNIRMADKSSLIIPLHIRTAIGLIISVLPASIIEIKHSMQKRAIESRLPHFLRDLAEISKNSVSIEKALQQLTERDYGMLSKHIKVMSAQISWGFPIDKILARFSNATKSWFSKMIAFILLEIMNIGGGRVETLSNLADFVERVNQLEKEKNSSLRLYGIIPYFGAIISILTLIIMLDVFMNPIGDFENRLTISDEDKSLLLTGSIIQAFATGMVAGKMGEGSVAAGFKHALILTIISLISVFIAPLLTDMFSF